MNVTPKAVTTLLPGVVGALALAFSLLADAAAAGGQDPAPVAAAPAIARLRWLAELDAESLVVPARQVPAAAPVVVSVPGAAYVFSPGPDGALRKRMRLPADSAAAYGLATAGPQVALADRLGAVSVWDVSPEAEPTPRWGREIGERVTSVGWDGAGPVHVATWSGRLVALSAEDGRPLWSVDLGGRADAPAVAEGSAVYVATKTKVLYRIDTATGAIRWKAALPGPALHPPALVGERPRLVVCGSWDGQLSAYSAVTGRLAWSAPLGARLAGAPLAGPGCVAVVTAEGAVRNYDLAGRLSWEAQAAAEGPATLLWQQTPGRAARLVSVSKVVMGLDPSTGERLADYPRGAREELRARFADAMLEGVKTYSEAEKRAAEEQEAFEIAGPVFGSARLFGTELAFGTEEGWAHLFDATTLRPIARHRAGRPADGVPRLAAGRVLAVAGEDVYGLDAQTGDVAWRRTVGAPAAIAGDRRLAVRAGGRVHAIDAADGRLAWTIRGDLRSVTPALPPDGGEPEDTPSLAEDAEGNLRALVSPGRLVGDPIPVGGELLAVVASSTGSWLVARRDGTLFAVAWDGSAARPNRATGGLAKAWEKTWGEPLSNVQLAGGRVLVRTAAGALVNFDPSSQQEAWRLALTKDDRVWASPENGALLVLGADALRAYDWTSGEPKGQQKLSLPALAAQFREGSLVWLDRLGRAHRAELGSEGAVAADLGVVLSEAAPTAGGFLVTTAAGEVGYVEVVGADVPSRGVRR